jgi:hypothetical protein
MHIASGIGNNLLHSSILILIFVIFYSMVILNATYPSSWTAYIGELYKYNLNQILKIYFQLRHTLWLRVSQNVNKHQTGVICYIRL